MVVFVDGKPLFLHLARERRAGCEQSSVVIRVELYEWFRLGPAEVIRAEGRAHLCTKYNIFSDAANAVHLHLFGERPVYWDEYEIYVRFVGPVRREHLGDLECRFYAASMPVHTRASPRLAAQVVEPLRMEDGTGEWIRIGLLRPFAPHPRLYAVTRAEIESKVAELISQERHHMNRGNAQQRRVRWRVHGPAQREGGAPAADERSAAAPRLAGAPGAGGASSSSQPVPRDCAKTPPPIRAAAAAMLSPVKPKAGSADADLQDLDAVELPSTSLAADVHPLSRPVPAPLDREAAEEPPARPNETLAFLLGAQISRRQLPNSTVSVSTPCESCTLPRARATCRRSTSCCSAA